MSDTRRRIRLCHLGMFVIALVANLAPPLFIPLRTAFGLDFEQLGRLALFNFITQLGCILIGGPLVDRFGARPFAVCGNLCTVGGLWLFASAHHFFPTTPYLGLVLGTVAFSIGGGMLELVLSPIVNAVPSERKAADMSLLHAFYAIGQIATVLLTSLAIWFQASWRVAVMCWSLLPLATAVGFLSIRIPPLVAEAQRQRMRELLRKPIYLAFMAGLFLAGATEMAVSQWISAYAEKGLGLPKLAGDFGGCCLFGAMLGAGRIWMGLRSSLTSLERALPVSCCIAIAAYVVAGAAPWSWLALTACVVAGLGVSLLWPGMLSLAARHFPRGGASMFAALSATGTLGCALAPWLVGLVADGIRTSSATPDFLARAGLALGPEPFGLRVGLLAAVVCPVAMLALVRWINRQPGP